MDVPWVLAASTAFVLAAQSLRAGRRRSALNEALHELRRPLQVLSLAGPASAPAPGAEWALQMAGAALVRLDHEINGDAGPAPAAVEVVAIEPLVEAATERWTARAALAGGSLELRWMATGAAVRGDRCGLAQALDNLLANAIEHGGEAVALEASRAGGSLRLAVVDSGGPRPRPRPARAAALVTRLRGNDRHGHGLAVVRRTVAAHGGSFALRRQPGRTAATIELPLLREGEAG